MSKFKVGDKVKAFGLIGEIAEAHKNPFNDKMGFRVLFIQDGFDQWFTEDGMLDLRHKEPALVLVQPAKTIVKKKLFVAVRTERSKYTSKDAHEVSYAYAEREDAENQFLKPNQIVSLEIEIEE